MSLQRANFQKYMYYNENLFFFLIFLNKIQSILHNRLELNLIGSTVKNTVYHLESYTYIAVFSAGLSVSCVAYSDAAAQQCKLSK